MEETIASSIAWIEDQQESMFEVQASLEDQADKNVELASKVDELKRDLSVVFRRIDMIYEKAIEYDDDLPSILLLDEMSAYTSIAQQVLSKIDELDILPKL